MPAARNSLKAELQPIGASNQETLEVDPEGKGVLNPGDKMVSNQPWPVSLVPEGPARAWTGQDIRDLLAFLLSRN